MQGTTDPAIQHPAELLKGRNKTGFGCSVLRRAYIKVFVLCPVVKEMVYEGGRWETTPCTAPLLSPSERETGVCESCAAGWETNTNRPATPEEAAEHAPLMAGVAEERSTSRSPGVPGLADEERDQRLYAPSCEPR
jgi:hypothetical protein